MTWLWRSMHPIAMPLLRIGFRIKVTGKQHIPKKGAAILASNHLSALDHVVLPAVTSRPIVNISKAQHFDKPLKAWFFKHWSVIRLERGAGDQAAMDAARQALREGKLFCIYPEGTRSRDGKLHKGHTGVARLALEMRVPVIPVAMKGTFEAYPKGGKMKLFTPTAAIVGPPLDFSQYWGMQDDRATCRKVTDEVMRAIQALSGQEYVDEYQHNPEVPSHAKRERDAAQAAAQAAAGMGASGAPHGAASGAPTTAAAAAPPADAAAATSPAPAPATAQAGAAGPSAGAAKKAARQGRPARTAGAQRKAAGADGGKAGGTRRDGGADKP